MSESLQRLRAAYDLERYDEAMAMAVQIIASDNPDREEGYHILMRSLILQERLDEASGYLNSALGYFPHEPYLFYLRAEILKRQDKPKEALKVIEEALSREPNAYEYHHLRSKLLLDLSRPVDAKRAIDHSLALEPSSPDLLCTLAIITYTLDNTIIACEIVNHVLAHHPHHNEALSLKSQICSATMSIKNTLLKRILSQDPFDSHANKEHRNIRRYYRIAPPLMGLYLLYAFIISLGGWEEGKSVQGSLLLLLSLYVWQDWRLSFPFFAVVVVLGGNIALHEWYIVPIIAIFYYAMGRISGTVIIIIYNKIMEIWRKGLRWMSR
jgi:hypothetical protein